MDPHIGAPRKVGSAVVTCHLCCYCCYHNANAAFTPGTVAVTVTL